MSDVDAIIVGAGISGLTLAFELKKKRKRVLVLEKNVRAGGSIVTERKNGWLIELGPNTVLANSVQVDALIRDAGLAGRRMEAYKVNKKRFILKKGRLITLPANPLNFMTTPLFSLKTKLGLLKEPFMGRAKEEESIAQFVRRRLGREMLDYAVGPFVSGVYAGDPEKLSVRWAVRKIYALEKDFGSLILGAIRKRKGPQPRGGLLSFPDGLEELPNMLAQEIGDVSTSSPVDRIEKTPAGFIVSFKRDGKSESASARDVFLTGNAKDICRFLAPLDSNCVLKDLPYAPVSIAAMGFARENVTHPLDGFGFLIPQIEATPVLGCLFTSSLFPGRAPEGKVLLTAFLGGARHPEVLKLDEIETLKTTLDFLRPLLGLTGEPEMTHVRIWPEAIPQYNLGHERFVLRAQEMEEKYPGLHFSGNLLHGVSVADCITNAVKLAGTI
jgi:protoporphyrinogen/coproporphyrinogen III oxidase